MFIGHTRFSLYDPAAGGWRASNGSRFRTVEEYRNYLFSPARLDPRFDIFLEASLPQLARASEGVRLDHIVSFSEEMPEKYRERLYRARDRFGFLVLDERVGGAASVSPFGLAASLYRDSGDAFGYYRLDDDDLLPLDYFAQVRRYITQANAGMMVSLGSGVTALYVDGRYYNIRLAYEPMIAIGLLSVCRYDEGRLVRPVTISHNRSDRANPVILDSRGIGFFWTRHIAQDTSLVWDSPTGDNVEDILVRYLDRSPEAAVDDGVEEAFPALRDWLAYRRRPTAGRSQLIRGPVALSRAPTPLPLRKVVHGTFKLRLEMDCAGGAGDNNALVSFELVDSRGARLESSDHAGVLAGTGMAASTDSDVGFFAYIPVGAGASEFLATIRLPEGIAMRGLSMRRLRRHDLDITVRNVHIQEAAPVSA